MLALLGLNKIGQCEVVITPLSLQLTEIHEGLGECSLLTKSSYISSFPLLLSCVGLILARVKLVCFGTRQQALGLVFTYAEMAYVALFRIRKKR